MMDPKPHHLLSMDSETWLSTPGRYVPPGVCMSFASEAEEWIELYQEGLDTFEGALRPGTLIAGAHNAYDNAVACAERPSLTPLVFDHYDRQGFHDVLIGQALDHVARGHLFRMPDGVSKMRLAPSAEHPNGQVKNRYGLELVTYQRLGRSDAKENDEWRKMYAELAHLPIEQWPPKARQYPLDDARNTKDVALDQLANALNMGPVVRVVPNKPPQQWEGVKIVWPGTTEPVQLTHMGLNAYAGWCLHLLSAWGLRVDAEALKKLILKVEATHASETLRFAQIGLLKPDGKDNGPEIKKRIIRAYNPGRGDVPCSVCKDSKDPKKGPQVGKVKNEKGTSWINCKACGATGIAIGNAPTTPTGDVKADRDTCQQSGDQDLNDLRASTNRKLRDTFIPFLTEGTVYPINVQSNVLVATARTSFGKQEDGDDSAPGLLQTFPRKGGARETIIPSRLPGDAPGMDPDEIWVWCSNDWNALEFANLGQAQLWVCGFSPIVEAINSGKDPHAILGAKMLGISYEEFLKRLKDPGVREFYKSIRQGTKAGNFGFGGRMGAAKFAWTQRRQRIGGHGSMCRLMSRESQHGCGKEMLTTWKKRAIDPICAQCCEVSEELRLGWLELWQLAEFFSWVDSHDGIRDGQGQMIAPGTGYIRGGLNVSEGCNNPFQHIGGYLSKLALCLVTREAYVDRGTALFGTRPGVFAHDEIITAMRLKVAVAAAARQTELMKYAARIICPDVEIGIAPALMYRWYKDAEDFYVASDWSTHPGCKSGWVFGTGEDGKPTRSQCPACKKTGILSPWEPPPWY